MKFAIYPRQRLPDFMMNLFDSFLVRNLSLISHWDAITKVSVYRSESEATALKTELSFKDAWSTDQIQ